MTTTTIQSQGGKARALALSKAQLSESRLRLGADWLDDATDAVARYAACGAQDGAAGDKIVAQCGKPG